MRLGLRPLTVIDLMVFALVVAGLGCLCAFAAIGIATLIRLG